MSSNQARGRSAEYEDGLLSGIVGVAPNPLRPAIGSTSLLVAELIEDRPDVGRRRQEQSSNSVPGGRPTFINSILIATLPDYT
jgi:hypothetical protein